MNICYIANINELNNWFYTQISCIECSDDAKAYITGVMKDYLIVTNSSKKKIDLANESIVLNYFSADNFQKSQILGDWILYTAIFNKEHFAENENIILDIGRSSYQKCNYFIDGRWPVYRELSRKLVPIISQAREEFRKIKNVDEKEE